MTQVKIINQSKNPLPAYQSSGAAGMDVYADIPTVIEFKPLDRVLIPTGLFVEIPVGFEIQVRPRSGLAMKQGITCLNTPGTIDSDYRGEIKVLLVNLSPENQSIQPGDRIAQLVLAKHELCVWKPETKLSETERAEGGFGSTGRT